MGTAPYDLINRWVSHAQAGRALDLGAGSGEIAIWLDKNGFEVDAIEADLTAFQRLKAETAATNIQSFHTDLRNFHFDASAYSLITAFGVFHFLRPTQLWAVADRIVYSLSPGGLLLCQVFTTDDPEFKQLRQLGSEMIEPNTYQLPSTPMPIHYFEPGELVRVFSALEVLHSEEYRRIDPDSEQGYRAGASFVGKKT